MEGSRLRHGFLPFLKRQAASDNAERRGEPEPRVAPAPPHFQESAQGFARSASMALKLAGGASASSRASGSWVREAAT